MGMEANEGERKFTFVLATHPCRTSLVVVLKPTVSRKGAGDYRTWSLIGTGCVEVVVAIARKLPHFVDPTVEATVLQPAAGQASRLSGRPQANGVDDQ